MYHMWKRIQLQTGQCREGPGSAGLGGSGLGGVVWGGGGHVTWLYMRTSGFTSVSLVEKDSSPKRSVKRKGGGVGRRWSCHLASCENFRHYKCVTCGKGFNSKQVSVERDRAVQG